VGFVRTPTGLWPEISPLRRSVGVSKHMQRPLALAHTSSANTKRLAYHAPCIAKTTGTLRLANRLTGHLDLRKQPSFCHPTDPSSTYKARSSFGEERCSRAMLSFPHRALCIRSCDGYLHPTSNSRAIEAVWWGVWIVFADLTNICLGIMLTNSHSTNPTGGCLKALLIDF
jgi:hypothetical protein